jgi:glutathionylspermidine synthase
MRRVPSTPRPDAMRLVQAEGLSYATDRDASGADRPYWREDAAYEFSSDEVDRLEAVTDELHAMAMAATRRMAHDETVLRRLGLPPGCWPALRASLDDEGAWSLYGRFDLAYDGSGEPRLLEYNADTPAGLVEAAVSQWSWLEALHPELDQWNLLHERLVQTFSRHVPPGAPMHFAVGANEPDEDWTTVAYLRDAAAEAGVETLGITMESIGFDTVRRRFVDERGVDIALCFKMYPWEWMLAEQGGGYQSEPGASTRWVEPMFKVLTGSKALLPVLWQMYPGHPNLLPATFDGPAGLRDWVAKPVFGWEGAGIQVVRGGRTQAAPERHTAGQQLVYQQYVDLPVLDGHRPVLGCWVVGGHAAGLGVRESTSLITDASARFVPHYLKAPRSSDEQVRAWLAQDP